MCQTGVLQGTSSLLYSYMYMCICVCLFLCVMSLVYVGVGVFTCVSVYVCIYYEGCSGCGYTWVIVPEGSLQSVPLAHNCNKCFICLMLLI